MQRLSKPLMFSVAITLLMCSLGWGQKPTAVEQLLPKTTKGAVLVSNWLDLRDHWNATQLGKLMDDPVMEPFAEDLKQQLQQRWSRVRDRLGLRLDDLRGVPAGEAALAMIAASENESALVLLMDVTGHVTQAEALLKTVTANMGEKKAKATRQSSEETTIILFELPATEEFPAGKVVYFLSGNLLGAADHQGVMEGILKRRLGQPTDEGSLADLPAFQAVMARCRKHAGDAAPQVRWFAEPLGYVEAVRAATPEEKRRKGVTAMDILRDQGFSAVQGVGGFIDMRVDDYELVHRTAIYAPKPYKAAPEPYKNKVSMDMFSLVNHKEFTPPDWVANDVAACRTLYWDVLKAFDNFGPTFDQIVGEGQEPGIWDDTLESLRTDPNGPQIDLRAELLMHLGQRVTAVTNYVLPITTTSERLLFAIEARDEAALAAGIRKMFQDDPTMKRREFEGVEIWETVDEPELHPLPADPLIDLPSATPKKRDAGQPARHVVEEEEEQRLLPHAAVAVAHGHLVIASHYDFLVETLTKAKTPDPLGQSDDYKKIDEAMKKLGAGDNCVHAFVRTDETFRPTYELVRMGKMPESETMLGRILNALLGPRKKGAVREQQVDGAKLPEYESIQHYFGPAGLFGAAEDDGWFLVGFTLKK